MVDIATLARQLRRRKLAPRTALRYAHLLADADRWCTERGSPLGAAAVELVEQWAETTTRSAAVRAQVRGALLHYWAVSERLDLVPLVRVPKKAAMVCKALDEGDTRILAKAARARGDGPGLAVAIGLYLGLRREEIATLRWDNFRGRWVHVVGKGERERKVPLHPVVAELLGAHPRRGPYLFPGQGRRAHASPATIWHWVRLVGEEAGVGRVHPHILRHTCLAAANDGTGDLRSTQSFAGHARPETTAGYTRTTAKRLWAIVDALDF